MHLVTNYHQKSRQQIAGGFAKVSLALRPPKQPDQPAFAGGQHNQSHQAFGGVVVMVLEAVLVADNLAVKLVNQLIDRSVQVFMGAFGKHVAAFDVDIAFSALASFFFFLFLNRQQYFYIHHLIEMPGDPVQLACHITSQGRGNFKVMAADCQVHT
jgi:hypothetical protein